MKASEGVGQDGGRKGAGGERWSARRRSAVAKHHPVSFEKRSNPATARHKAVARRAEARRHLIIAVPPKGTERAVASDRKACERSEHWSVATLGGERVGWLFRLTRR